MMDVTAQTVIYSEDFNSLGNSFTMNTSDLGGSMNSNQWVWNLGFLGGDFMINCSGFDLPVSIADTPNQPAGIAGSPQSKYMHIVSTGGLQSGVGNCHFIAADGFCNFSESYFASMTSSINTVGQTGVTLSFWWLCAGLAGNSYGEVYYSTDGGGSWIPVPGGVGEYSNQPDWTQETITNAAFDNQANLKFGFRFETLESLDPASDPAFGVDDILVTANQASTNSITTGNILLGPYCPGQAISVPFTANGTFNAGNTFTAQLSNSSGSFASPVVIGTLSSTTSGVINANIPLGTAVGANYLIRVVANSPNTTGTPSVITIEVAGAPTSAISNASSTTVCSGGTASLIFQGSPGTIQWSSSTNNTTFTPIAGATSATYTSGPLTQTTYYQVSVTSSCGVTTSSTWTVNLTNAIVIPVSYTPNSLNLCNGPVTLSVTGNYTDLVWSNGQAGTAVISISNPITISVTGTDASGCSGASTPLTFTSIPPPPLSITPASPVTLCGASATLTASAGFVSYNWSNGQTGSTVVVNNPGSFIVSATDANGCVVTSSATQVISGSSVSIPVEPSLAAICDGEPAVLTAGTGFSQYEWSNGAIGQTITVSATGYYSVTATDVNGCPGSSPLVEVIQSQFPIANFAYSQGVGGYTISFNNNSQNGLSYEWAFDSIGTSPLRDPSFTFPDSGPYDITLIISNPCGADTITKTIIVALVGMEDLGSGDEINVFPNPSDSDFHLVHTQAANTVSEIILRDLTGRLVFEKSFDTNQGLDISISGSALPAGTYVACVHFKSGYRYYRIAKK
jgi:hypothetical protein